jgi:uncharacterized membrane protein YdjX (TVP38/TMEM64 family)
MQKIAKYVLGIFAGISIFLMIYCVSAGHCFSLTMIKQYTTRFDYFVSQHYIQAAFLYIGLFAGLIIVAFPVITPISILGGYSFGVVLGATYACLGATIGSLITFSLFRYVFAEMIQQKYAYRLHIFNKHVQEEGYSYLLMLHFLLVPFFIINTLAAVTPISWWTFIWTTVVGTVPIFLVHSFAGRQLRHLNSIHRVLSWPIVALFASLLLLAFLPIAIKRLYRWYK